MIDISQFAHDREFLRYVIFPKTRICKNDKAGAIIPRAMEKERLKKAAAEAALPFIPPGANLGVGTGSTAGHFIAALPAVRAKISRVVASSEETARLLENAGFACADPNAIGGLDLYVDGADEADNHLRLVKGGGGAHAREKVLAAAARRFVCIIDDSKKVDLVGNFPLPVEVLPMARALVARKLAAMGGSPEWREGFVTDNGNWILDVRGLDLSRAEEMERDINAIPGAVENGVFARRRADLLVIAGPDGVRLEGREAP